MAENPIADLVKNGDIKMPTAIKEAIFITLFVIGFIILA